MNRTTPETRQQEAARVQAEPTPCRFSSQQYRWLIDAGILTTEHRVELIEGEIRTMAPMGPAHRRSMRRLNTWLVLHAGDQYVVESQLSIDLSEAFTPDPDFILARWREDGYPEGENPGRDDVLLAIEVADSSLEYNLGDKARAYARTGIPELWVVDIPHRQIHVFIHPSADGYQSHAAAGEDEAVTALLIPNLRLPVSEAL